MAAKSVYERFGASQLSGSDQSARRHVVVAGETIWMIAAQEFGTGQYDSEAWRELAEAQSPPIDDLDSIAVGTVLVIPSILPSTT